MTRFICDKCKKEIYLIFKPRTIPLCRECQKKMSYERAKQYRTKLKNNHMCINCYRKVEPVTYYPVRCNKCRKKQKEKK